jgi:hypothetical protein
MGMMAKQYIQVNKMADPTVFDFLSRECKNDLHDICHSYWEGLGFQAACSCTCHEQQTK